MNLFGVFGALLIGIVLGLIGGGGSILTVPIFVYVLDVEPVLATAYSLFVVGIAALFGAIKNAQENLVEYKTGFVFAIPAFIGVYIARRFLLDLIPNIIINIGNIRRINIGINIYGGFIYETIYECIYIYIYIPVN